MVTYSPHCPNGSDDKLYEITAALDRVTRPESVGGTPANRMIHDESGQLFIGPYAIDRHRRVRVIAPRVMPGRLTGNARHLTDPANKIYVATMEEGLYEVDVDSLEVNTLFADANRPGAGGVGGRLLPGCHGKGLYSGQGRLIYATTANLPVQRSTRPDIPSGLLASWDGAEWTVVRRNQFTEVTGPGGLHGNAHPSSDPVWSIGWDHRSLILMLLRPRNLVDVSTAKSVARLRRRARLEYRMASDPRHRRSGPADDHARHVLALSPHIRCAPIRRHLLPRSTYLKVVGDFCRWHRPDRLGLRRCGPYRVPQPPQEQRLASRSRTVPVESLVRHATPSSIISGHRLRTWRRLGRRRGRAGVVSDAFLFDGFERRGVHLAHNAGQPGRVPLRSRPAR